MGTGLNMPFKDLREFLSLLEKNGELVRVKEEVDLKYEIAAYIRKTSDIQGPALLFEKVRGHKIPVVGGVFATRKLALMALEATNENVLQKFLSGIRNPIPSKLVKGAPCQEVVLEDANVDSSKFPIPIYSEEDAGRYITVGVQISKDPETRTKNASIYRMQVKSKNRLGIMAPAFQHISTQFAKAEDKGEPLEIAIPIGVDPVIPYASQVKAPYGFDELEIAGGIRGQPVDVVKCKTVDLEVPATAEIVIEGKVLPNVRDPEGPFGEFTGFYGKEEQNPVVEVTAITHRENPIFQAGLTGLPTTENHVLKEFPYEAALYEKLKKEYPEVQNVCYSPAGGAQFLVFISLKQRYKGEARNVILSALGDSSRPKIVIAVDEDVDIFDPTKVLWALSFCAQPAEDVIIVPSTAGGPLDPSVPEKDVTSVMGIDATRRFGVKFPEVVAIPGLKDVKIPKLEE